MLKLSLTVIQKITELVEFLKSKSIDEKKIEEKASKILAVAKGIEGFVGNGWSSEEQLLIRIKNEIRTHKVAGIVYALIALIAFPIMSLFLGVFSGLINSIGLFLFSYAFFSIFTAVGIIIVLRMK